MPIARGTSGQAGSAPGLPGGSALRWRAVFRGAEAEVRQVRRWLASLLPECEARDDLVLVAGELCSNAIRHTASGRGGFFTAEVTWHGGIVRIAVADGGAPHGPHLVDDPMAERGRGLKLVQALCCNTGFTGDHRGRLVWADVLWSGPGAALPARFGDGCEAAIRDGLTFLASRHGTVTAWFGCSTLQWWALAGRPGPADS